MMENVFLSNVVCLFDADHNNEDFYVCFFGLQMTMMIIKIEDDDDDDVENGT